VNLADQLRVVRDRLGARAPERSIEHELAHRVDERIRALGLPSVEAYLVRLGRAPADEVPHLATPFTNGWTWFFRDSEPLETLAARLAGERRAGPISVWVAGCSTGEEAYGTAMIFLEHGLDVRVVGTDVDVTRIREAEAAVYGPASLRRVGPSALGRHFEPVADGRWRVCRAVRSVVELRVHNLLDPPLLPPRPGAWDAIVCRNVLLHLSPDAASAVRRQLETASAQALLFGPADLAARTRTVFRPPSSPALVAPRAESTRPPPPAHAPDPADPWRACGALLSTGAHDAARALLRELLRAQPEHVDARLTLGNLFVEAHAFDEALAAYVRAEELEPCCPELHFLRGTLHRKQGEWGAAASSLRRALFHDPQFWPARFLLAGVWDRTGEGDRARRALEETLVALDARPVLPWRSHVSAIESIACPPHAVRTACLRRLGREREIESKGA
jgi:chemotaxis protein methyltransferase CheR